MEMSFKQWLEGSYTQADVPPHYYLCCHLNVQQLLSGKLAGVEGISSNVQTTADFLDQNSPVVLKMPSQELLKDNRLSRMMYDNPNYMSSRNFEPTMRVGGRTDGWSHNDSDSILGAIMDELEEMQVVPDLSAAARQAVWEMKDRFNNTGTLAKLITNLLAQNGYNVDFRRVQDVVNRVMKRLGGEYADEHEWRVKPQWQRIDNEIKRLPVLIVPPNSEMMIAWNILNPADKENFAKSGLLNKYRTYVCMAQGDVGRDEFAKFDSGQWQPTTNVEELMRPQAKRGWWSSLFGR